MRRADRLFQIVQLLRRRRTVTTAKQIASRLEISERTVYRDIRDLVLAGTPIDGEAGVGYRIRAGYDLPPLMFDREEIQALVLGARIVRQFGDPALARASDPRSCAREPGTPRLRHSRIWLARCALALTSRSIISYRRRSCCCELPG